jgi:uncharacterized protein YacL
MLIIIRLAFLTVATLIGFIIGGLPGAGVGLLVGALGVLVELGLGWTSGRTILAGAGGLLIGLVVGTAVGYLVSLAPGLEAQRFAVFGCSYLVFAYLGILIAVRKWNELVPFAASRVSTRAGDVAVKLLDTSAIIDGRVADVAETRFLEGRVVIPRFVLRELQLIADSPDPLRRARGRRGLEILKRLQQGDDVAVEIEDVDVKGVRDVDAKLVKLAMERSARVITTDFNLNRVADLEGVAVLNLNDLANALKPVVLPGETLTVQIMKKGKEQEQGVGYLDDGTMVVVEKAAGLIGQELTVMTTSVLQTAAGRMIFAETKS